MTTLVSSSTTIKLVVLGDSGVGKSSLALRFVSEEFRPYSESTIGASFMSKTILLKARDVMRSQGTSSEGNSGEISASSDAVVNVTFKIWDTAGQEKYRSLAPMYYRGARAALLVFDLTHHGTFAMLKSWVDELRSHGPDDIVIGLCGNKCDLGERSVSSEEAQRFATEELKSFYMETSAKNNINIYEVFEAIAKLVPYQQEFPTDLPEEQRANLLNGTIDLGYRDVAPTTRGGYCC